MNKKSIGLTCKSEKTYQDCDVYDKFKNINPSSLEIEIGYGLISFADELQEKIGLSRYNISSNLGFIMPNVRIRDNTNLSDYEYVIRVNSVEVGRWLTYEDKVLVILEEDNLVEFDGIEVEEPLFSLKAKWVSSDFKEKAKAKKCTIADIPQIIGKHFEKIVKNHAYEILDRQMTKELIDYVSQTNSVLVNELHGVLTLGEIQKVLSNLLREGISINSLNIILETLADNVQILGKDTDLLTECVRLRLIKQIVASLDQEGRDIHYVIFDEKSETIIIDSLRQTTLSSIFLLLKVNLEEKFMQQLENYVIKILDLGKVPVIMCSPKIRLYLNRYIESRLPFVKVFSHDELASAQVELHNEGVISLEE